MLPRVLSSLALLAHSFIEAILRASGERPLALDGTAGNGHDTRFLARTVGCAGHVLAYDIQKAALAATASRLKEDGLGGRVTLLGHSHEHINGDLLAFFGCPEPRPAVDAAMFNFGYLPGSDKTIVTTAAASLAAFQGLLPWMRPGGGISLHLYAGHSGGAAEAQALAAWAATLSWKNFRVQSTSFANKSRNPETLLLVEVLR